jgi:hypothetical protein
MKKGCIQAKNELLFTIALRRRMVNFLFLGVLF